MIDFNWYEAGVRVLFGIFGLTLGIIMTMKFSKLMNNKQKAMLIDKDSTLGKVWKDEEEFA